MKRIQKINNFVLNENIRNIKRKVENIIAHYDRYNPTVSALDDFFHKLVYDLFQKTNDNIKITMIYMTSSKLEKNM